MLIRLCHPSSSRGRDRLGLPLVPGPPPHPLLPLMLDPRDYRLLRDFVEERTIDFERFVLEASSAASTIEEAEAEAEGVRRRLDAAARAAENPAPRTHA